MLKLYAVALIPGIYLAALLAFMSPDKATAAISAGGFCLLAGWASGIVSSFHVKMARWIPVMVGRLASGRCPDCDGELRVCSRAGGDEVVCRNHRLGHEYRLVGDASCNFMVTVNPNPHE